MYLICLLIGGALGVKQVNAAGAVEGLTSDPNTILVDIRSREEVKEQGSPNLSSTNKKAITLPFTRVRDSCQLGGHTLRQLGRLKCYPK